MLTKFGTLFPEWIS